MPIDEQDVEAITETFIDVLARIGQLGRDAREAIDAKLAELGDSDVDVMEGVSQLESLFGE